MIQYHSWLWQCELLFIPMIANLIPPTRANLVASPNHLLHTSFIFFHNFLLLFISTMELYASFDKKIAWLTVVFSLFVCWSVGFGTLFLWHLQVFRCRMMAYSAKERLKPKGGRDDTVVLQKCSPIETSSEM